MRLTERDKRILETIHAFDGMMGFSQIRRLFFTGKSQAEERMKLLYQNRYVNRPTREQRGRVPEMIYWLDRRGAEMVASELGLTLKETGWRKEPRWIQVEHDLAVNDFRLDITEACQANPEVSLETWIPEYEFRAYPDRIEFTYGDHRLRRNMRPDSYFIIVIPKYRNRYLLEIDRGTEDHHRFLREKILPGLAYLKSKAYEERFGYRSGRWLVVTTSDERMENMLRQARGAETKGLFYFTTYDKIDPGTLLFSPIWQRADRDEPVPLLFID